jgi:NAD(P)-dependent dehydrogenase (short-subunit alcohol dehydrogenase family)
MGRLSGKVAIITGAASGMGKEIARLFAEEGAKVVATDVQEEVLQVTVKNIAATYGDSIIGLKLDVTSESDWKAVVEDTVSKYGNINALVNNAGYTSGVQLEDTTIDVYTRTMNINALGNLLGILAVLPSMKENGQGSIVNISSIGGIVGGQGGATYSMSKGASRLLTKDAAVELAKYNIRVNSIHPGAIATEMTVAYLEANPEIAKGATLTMPLGRFGDPIDIAYTALFLASDESKYQTGSEVIVDGGVTCK